MQPVIHEKKKRFQNPVLNLLLIILLILTFYPLAFTFITSFKDNNQFFTNFWGFANPVHLENYRDAFSAIMPSSPMVPPPIRPRERQNRALWACLSQRATLPQYMRVPIRQTRRTPRARECPRGSGRRTQGRRGRGFSPW